MNILLLIFLSISGCVCSFFRSSSQHYPDVVVVTDGPGEYSTPFVSSSPQNERSSSSHDSTVTNSLLGSEPWRYSPWVSPLYSNTHLKWMQSRSSIRCRCGLCRCCMKSSCMGLEMCCACVGSICRIDPYEQSSQAFGSGYGNCGSMLNECFPFVVSKTRNFAHKFNNVVTPCPYGCSAMLVDPTPVSVAQHQASTHSSDIREWAEAWRCGLCGESCPDETDIGENLHPEVWLANHLASSHPGEADTNSIPNCVVCTNPLGFGKFGKDAASLSQRSVSSRLHGFSVEDLTQRPNRRGRFVPREQAQRGLYAADGLLHPRDEATGRRFPLVGRAEGHSASCSVCAPCLLRSVECNGPRCPVCNVKFNKLDLWSHSQPTTLPGTPWAAAAVNGIHVGKPIGLRCASVRLVGRPGYQCPDGQNYQGNLVTSVMESLVNAIGTH